MGTISRTSLNTGDILTAAEWNTQFDTIYNEFNGSVDTINIANDAITGPKIADGAVSANNLGLLSHVVAFSYNASIGATAESIRQMRFPFAGTLTKIDAKSATTPGPQNLTINLTDDGTTMLNASALSMTGTSLVSLEGGNLIGTSIAAQSILELDIINFGTATGGGESLTVNLYIDVAGTEL